MTTKQKRMNYIIGEKAFTVGCEETPQRPTALGHGARYRARRKRTAPRHGQYGRAVFSPSRGQVRSVSLNERVFCPCFSPDLEATRLQLDAQSNLS